MREIPVLDRGTKELNETPIPNQITNASAARKPTPAECSSPFEQDDERRRIVGRFCLARNIRVGRVFLHGGIIAVLLDEVMSKLSRFTGELAVTADLYIEYKRPIRVNTEIIVEGFVTRREGSQLYHEGEIRNATENYSRAEKGRFVVIDREKYAARDKRVNLPIACPASFLERCLHGLRKNMLRVIPSPR